MVLRKWRGHDNAVLPVDLHLNLSRSEAITFTGTIGKIETEITLEIKWTHLGKRYLLTNGTKIIVIIGMGI
jgi:hypothetical protein